MEVPVDRERLRVVHAHRRPDRVAAEHVLVLAPAVQLEDLLVVAVHEIARAIDPSWVAGEKQGGFAGVVDHWVVVPAHLARWISPVSYVGLIAVALVVTMLRGRARLVALVPTLYLAAFVWENVMLSKPEPARYIVLGLILIALMILRPNGLLGERRVEIV